MNGLSPASPRSFHGSPRANTRSGESAPTGFGTGRFGRAKLPPGPNTGGRRRGWPISLRIPSRRVSRGHRAGWGRINLSTGPRHFRQKASDCMVKLTVRERESIQEAVRRFRKLVERSGIKKEMRKREFFEKPSETRRRARLRAERRMKRNRLLGV